jgi:hypothetical protein
VNPFIFKSIAITPPIRITPSLDRVEPRCTLANICGGCQYQHLTIERQRGMKTEQVQDSFERVGGLDREDFSRVLDTIGTREIYILVSKQNVRFFADQLLSKITHISHSILINSVICTPHYEAPIKKRDKTIIDPDSPLSLEIGPIGFKEKASRRLGGDHKPSTRTNTKRQTHRGSRK